MLNEFGMKIVDRNNAQMCASRKIEVLNAELPSFPSISMIVLYKLWLWVLEAGATLENPQQMNPWLCIMDVSSRGSIAATWLKMGWLCSDEPRGRQIEVYHIPPFWVQ